MSGGGGGVIIIQNLIDNPGTTADEKALCRAILARMQGGHKCDCTDRRKVGQIVNRLLKGV